MADNGEVRLVEDFEGAVKLYSDGSVVRAAEPSWGSQEDNYVKNVSYKDVVFEEEIGLWARLYLPQTDKGEAQLPVLLYFHGGGFCLATPASPVMHRMCLRWAAKLGAIIVSVNYRLTPENRLPAAYEDAIAALQWLHNMKNDGAVGDPWLRSRADFSKIFVMGESAGGNIAHHVGLWVGAAGMEMGMEIKGMILVYPFFGGEDRMRSEEAAPSMFRVEQSDVMWRMALPVGSNRDHPFCNPVGEWTESADSSVSLSPILFVIAGHDILRDKQLQYCEVLKKCGQEVGVVLFEEEDHGFTLMKVEDQSSVELLCRISDFIK
ncbi:hypothetical protein KI387_014318 [Taxus chinensis]|uniref:Alpha/beta hydrolase fold-3 domain-containing protein n=1 Tax=Taxus chinensis TaxID=29808 RepID=A0AA38CM01_TAXCH|nr:hypothetical protein KI387_014318 [Taxus chinensis]